MRERGTRSQGIERQRKPGNQSFAIQIHQTGIISDEATHEHRTRQLDIVIGFQRLNLMSRQFQLLRNFRDGLIALPPRFRKGAARALLWRWHH
jgi:hypothetical protein